MLIYFISNEQTLHEKQTAANLAKKSSTYITALMSIA